MEHIGLYLKDIFFTRKSGQIIFRHGQIQKFLIFYNGNLVSANSNQPEELLAEVLLKLGKIEEEAYKNIDQFSEPQMKQGEVLVKNGVISENDLQEGLSIQMREILLNTFADFKGEFKFVDRNDLDNQEFEIKINIPLLIEDGIRRMKYDPALKILFEKTRPFPKSKSYFYRLTEEEKELLNVIKGDLSAEAILEESRINPEKFWRNLYLFYCLDLIDLPDEAGKRPALKAKRKTTIGDKEKNIADALALGGKLSQMDHYELLDVESTAGTAEIKRNYFRLARKFHPDLYDRDLPNEIKSVIEAVFERVSEAYQTLSDENKRKVYDKGKEKPKLEDKRNWVKMAEVKFRQGKTLYDKGRFQDAIMFLEEAVKMDGKKGIYYLLLAMTQSKIPALRRKSEDNFLRSIQYEPWNAESYVGLGIMYKREGLKIKAKKQFEKALSIDPDHKIAKRELNSFDDTKKKTFKDYLSMDLFGKKK